MSVRRQVESAGGTKPFWKRSRRQERPSNRGATCGAVDAAAPKRFAAQRGWAVYFVHSTGSWGSVLEIHENPRIARDQVTLLETGKRRDLGTWRIRGRRWGNSDRRRRLGDPRAALKF